VFDTPLPENVAAIVPAQALSDAPHPFILEPPEEGQSAYGRNDCLDFHLVLVGKAIDYFPYFLFAFDELGRIGLGKGRGRYKLIAAYSVDVDGEGLVYRGDTRRLVGVGRSVSLGAMAQEHAGEVQGVEIVLLTPTRLKYGRKLTDQLEFYVLFRALLLRMALLTLCHGSGGRLPLPSGDDVEARAVVQYFYRDARLEATSRQRIWAALEEAKQIVVERSELQWYDWERYSARQDTRMKLGGVVGRVHYKGPLTGFLPYLRFGEFVHVGKSTSFGLGKMQLYTFTTLEG
jgi:hypothetical protein